MVARPRTAVPPSARLVLCLTIGHVLLAGCATDVSGASDSTSQAPGALDASTRGHSDPQDRDAEPAPTGSDAGKLRVPDATSAARDASARDGGGGSTGCMLGEAGSFATDASLNLFGEVTYFAKGQALPKGRYRASYEDGCMKYNTLFSWTVNAATNDGWWLVGTSSSDKVALLPGTAPANFFGGYADFDACVTANAELPATEFDFAGGKLGIWLNDTPYQDNQAGTNGRNPKWSLTLLVEECPPDLILI